MNDSYVSVSAEIARQRATLKIEEIKGRREEAWKDRIIEEQIQRARLRLWFPWLKSLCCPWIVTYQAL